MGKFLLGVFSGGLLVTGGLVVSSMLFPTEHANDNAVAPPAVEQPVSEPASKDADVAASGEEAPEETAATKDQAPSASEDGEAAAGADSAKTAATEAEAAPAEPAPVAPATETATAEATATDSGTETAAAPEETASVQPEGSDTSAKVAATSEAKTAEPAAAEPKAGADTAVEPTATADASVAAPEPQKPQVADAPPAPAAPQDAAALADAGAPSATEVTAPETAAEPSKPAATVADTAAVAPDPAPSEAPAATDATTTATADATAAAPAPSEPAAAPVTETTTAEALPAEPSSTEPAPTGTAAAEPTTAPAEAATETAAAPEDPAPVEVAEAAPAETQPVTETPAATAPATEPAPATEAAPADPAPAEEAPAVQAPDPAPEVMPAAPEAAPKPGVKLADATPGQDVPDMPGTKPEGLPEAAVEMITPDAPIVEGSGPTFKPAPGLTGKGDGVVIKRGNAVEQAPDESAAAATPPADTRPIAAYAAKFENPDARPPFAIVLIDDGRADLDRAGLAALPLPVSIALDPLDPATPERAASYRAAGKEVVMLVTGIAQGAQASDVEVAFQSMAQGLPEAVAAMDLVQPAFQNNRGLAAAVVPILKAQGRGLLTWDAGLNAADQVARREDLEAAVVFRDLDQAKGDQAGMRRLLDRAVFKAGQEGRVAVVATADADTLTGLLEWSVEGKAATVAVAPLTAVLTIE